MRSNSQNRSCKRVGRGRYCRCTSCALLAAAAAATTRWMRVCSIRGVNESAGKPLVELESTAELRCSTLAWLHRHTVAAGGRSADQQCLKQDLCMGSDGLLQE